MNRGAAWTQGKIRDLGLSQNAAAELVGADSGNFSKILRAEKKPGRSLAARCRAEFGTELEWWDEPYEVAAVPEPGPEAA